MVATTSITDAKVGAVFNSYDGAVRSQLLALRALILETADDTAGVGAIEEILKWGQPSYITSESRSGSTIRIAPTSETSPYDYALYFICNTNLVENFSSLFGDTFVYEGNRALLFDINAKLPTDELRVCIGMALRYHLDKGTGESHPVPNGDGLPA